MKKVLTILASYQGEKYIQDQLLSILCQENVLVDIIVFDDGSTDQTQSIVELLNENRVSFLRNKKPTGSAANNFLNAIKSLDIHILNQYDFIALADQDDVWLPNKIIRAIEMLSQNNASLYLSNLILWEQQIDRKSIIRKDFSQKEYDYLFEGGSAGCTYVFTSEFCKKLQKQLMEINYEDCFFLSHDWLIYFYARINKYSVFFDNIPLILYRIHEYNVHGHLNVPSFYAMKHKLKLVLGGWYIDHIKGLIMLTESNSEEYKIYNQYMNSWFSRVYVLVKYNFKLMRSKRKFIQFALVSLFPVFKYDE
jgi:rhamnosyltransferase